MNFRLLTIALLTVFVLSECRQAGRKNRQGPELPISAGDSISSTGGSGISNDLTNSFDILIEEYEETDRGEWQNPALVLNKLGDLNGKVVADIGSGTGYFTFRMAKLAQKVIAIDIEQRFLDYIEERKLEVSPRIANVIETRQTVEDDPNLAVEEVDAILMVNVYYYLKNRVAYMKKVQNALRDGGHLVLVDFKPGELPMGPIDNKVPPAMVLSDLKEAGFDNLQIDTKSLQYQYIINGTK